MGFCRMSLTLLVQMKGLGVVVMLQIVLDGLFGFLPTLWITRGLEAARQVGFNPDRSWVAKRRLMDNLG